MESGNKYQSFTELNVWKEARSFQLFIFNSCKSFHSEEKFKLEDQSIRAPDLLQAILPKAAGDFILKKIRTSSEAD